MPEIANELTLEAARYAKAARDKNGARRTAGEIRMDPSGDRRLTGYAIVFNTLSLDLGGFKERILPQAVDRTLAENIDVRALFNHDPGKVIGRARNGTLRLRTDGHGLSVAITPPTVTDPTNLLESIDRGDITGMSFGFRTLEDDWHMEDGIPVCEVLDMRIREVSIVSFPAYTDTDIQVAQRALQEFQAASQTGTHSPAWWTRWHQQQLAR